MNEKDLGRVDDSGKTKDRVIDLGRVDNEVKIKSSTDLGNVDTSSVNETSSSLDLGRIDNGPIHNSFINSEVELGNVDGDAPIKRDNLELGKLYEKSEDSVKILDSEKIYEEEVDVNKKVPPSVSY